MLPEVFWFAGGAALSAAQTMWPRLPRIVFWLGLIVMCIAGTFIMLPRFYQVKTVTQHRRTHPIPKHIATAVTPVPKRTPIPLATPRPYTPSVMVTAVNSTPTLRPTPVPTLTPAPLPVVLTTTQFDPRPDGTTPTDTNLGVWFINDGGVVNHFRVWMFPVLVGEPKNFVPTSIYDPMLNSDEHMIAGYRKPKIPIAPFVLARGLRYQAGITAIKGIYVYYIYDELDGRMHEVDAYFNFEPAIPGFEPFDPQAYLPQRSELISLGRKVLRYNELRSLSAP